MVRRMGSLFAALSLVLVVALATVGCGPSGGGGEPQGGAPSEQQTGEGAAGQGASTQAAPARIGEKVTSGTWDLVVDRATAKAALDYKATGEDTPAAEGKELMVIEVSLTNNADAPAGTGPAYFKLADAGGTEYTETVTNVQGWLFNMNPVQAAETVKTTVVYEVPKGSAGLVLTFDPPTAGGTSDPKSVAIR